MAKKLLAILAALCLMAAMGSVGASAVPGYDLENDRPALYAIDSIDPKEPAAGNGEFHILVLPDTHQTADADPNLIAYIESAIKYAEVTGHPVDLIIFLGDMVSGSGCASAATITTAVQALLGPIKAAQIPFTVLFGNHDLGDTHGAVTGAEVLQIWKDEGGTMDIEYEVQVPVPGTDPIEYTTETQTETMPLFVDPDENVPGSDATTGVTNFKYTVYQKLYRDMNWDDGRTTYGARSYKSLSNRYVDNTLIGARPIQLFLFDVGSKDAGQEGYDYVRADQLAWFTANNVTDQPAFVFQHIALPEVYGSGYFLKSPFNWKLPGTINVLETNYFGTANFINMVGTVLEAPCPPNYSDGEFEAITEGGNVQAAFFGHDHVNNYVERFKEQKIDLVQLPGAAWNGSYGTYLVRGGSFVVIRPDETGTGGVSYDSSFFTYRQAARVPGSQVKSTINGFKDWIMVIPFLLQNFIMFCFAPVRWIMGGF